MWNSFHHPAVRIKFSLLNIWTLAVNMSFAAYSDVAVKTNQILMFLAAR